MSLTPNPITINPIMRSQNLSRGSQLVSANRLIKRHWFPVGKNNGMRSTWFSVGKTLLVPSW